VATVTEPLTTPKVAKLLAAATLPIVLHEEAELALAAVELNPSKPDSSDHVTDIVLVVGPEGGISPEELAQFADAGAKPHRIGPTVLRTSTAGTAAAAVLLAHSGRWG
jgi:16S rRNA (uracil1498-N3)-methyltransferase